MVVSHSLRSQWIERAGIWFPYLGCFHFEIYFKLLLVVGWCMCVCDLCMRTGTQNVLGTQERIGYLPLCFSAFFYFMHVHTHFACLYLCLHTTCLPGSSGTAVSAVRHCVGTGNRTQGLLQEQQVLHCALSLQPLSTLLFETLCVTCT